MHITPLSTLAVPVHIGLHWLFKWTGFTVLTSNIFTYILNMAGDVASALTVCVIVVALCKSHGIRPTVLLRWYTQVETFQFPQYDMAHVSVYLLHRSRIHGPQLLTFQQVSWSPQVAWSPQVSWSPTLPSPHTRRYSNVSIWHSRRQNSEIRIGKQEFIAGTQDRNSGPEPWGWNTRP